MEEEVEGYIVSIKYSKMDLNISENPTSISVFNVHDTKMDDNFMYTGSSSQQTSPQ